MNARRWIDFLLPDALSVHSDWLRQFTAGDGQLLAKVMRSRSARLLLTRRLYKLHEIAVPERVKLRANQQWLLTDHDANESTFSEGAQSRIIDPVPAGAFDDHRSKMNAPWSSTSWQKRL
jgi:hypothetical protein